MAARNLATQFNGKMAAQAGEPAALHTRGAGATLGWRKPNLVNGRRQPDQYPLLPLGESPERPPSLF
eukprot:scaffold6826_cov81-Isochrysis_galbana.AAC.1